MSNTVASSFDNFWEPLKIGTSAEIRERFPLGSEFQRKTC
jgi:hypothetical protein